MSILIKGMKLPKACHVCPMFDIVSIRCLYTCRLIDRDDFFKMRDSNCPLEEVNAELVEAMKDDGR